MAFITAPAPRSQPPAPPATYPSGTAALNPKKRPSKLAAAAAPTKPTLQQRAQAVIDPVLAQLTGNVSGEAQQAAAAIKGLTDAYAQDLAGTDYTAPYAGAEAKTAAVDAALRQALAGGGADLASGLSSRLGALEGTSGANALHAAAAGLGSQGVGAGNQALDTGSAALNDLIAQEAAARLYGTKMPGVADLAGIQGENQVGQKATQLIAQGTQQAEGQLPTIEQQLRSDALQAKSLKATKAYHNAELGLSAAKANASIQQGNARLGIEQQNANTAAARAAQSALNENRNYQLALGRLGVEHKRLQLEALTAQTKLKSGGFTPMELVKLRQTAGSVIASAKQNGYTRKQVVNNLVANGVPLGLAKPILKRFGYAPIKKIPAVPLKRGPNGLISAPGPGLSFPLASSAPTGALNSITAGAKARGLDPKAVLAIASQEGLGGGIGDNGTSFGPFQLHVGGVFPQVVWEWTNHNPQLANQWAWSPQGINYALDHMASVAKGLKGRQAVAAISKRFERPANPAQEIAGALGVYGKVG